MTAALRFGYGTNGLADHSLPDALSWLADEGYDGVAVTLDHRLDPLSPGLAGRAATLGEQARDLGLGVVVETGARFVLDRAAKHHPTLCSDDPAGRRRRLDYLRLAVDAGEAMGAEAVSFWSGTPDPGVPATRAWDHLVAGCAELVEYAAGRGVILGFEPEPGMLVDRIGGYGRLAAALGDPPGFGLTLDVGHCRCNEDDDIVACVRRAGPRLVNVQIEDMRRGVHEHLDFGEGEIDFPPALAALGEVGYTGLVAVELPRHSHAAHEVVPRALAFLRAAAGERARSDEVGRRLGLGPRSQAMSRQAKSGGIVT
jgi:sugar phosphate isomerase/epimerase